jgi:hypothetical protein
LSKTKVDAEQIGQVTDSKGTKILYKNRKILLK